MRLLCLLSLFVACNSGLSPIDAMDTSHILELNLDKGRLELPMSALLNGEDSISAAIVHRNQSTIMRFTSQSLRSSSESRAIQGEPRILFKKIKKFISDRLLYALVAILLIIKLIAIKVLFFLPMMVGAVAAKKLLIKVLLFVFPVLKHLFKLCPYAHHGPKYHHHKHQIAHIHHVGDHHPGPHDTFEYPSELPGPVEIDSPSYGHPSTHWGSSYSKPSYHHYIDSEPPHKNLYNPHEQELEYYSGGPSLSHHFINHRKDQIAQLQPWGPKTTKLRTKSSAVPTAEEIEATVLKAEKEALLKAKLENARLKLQQENLRLQENLKVQSHKIVNQPASSNGVSYKRKLPQYLMAPPPQRSTVITQATPFIPTAPPLTTTTLNLVKPVQQYRTDADNAIEKEPSATYDPLYSPILAKIDKILVAQGFPNEGCKERAICSMYKNPTKFAPYSNFLSAELSREHKDTALPLTTNAAVIRFFRYVRAARDGQNQKQCVQLYTDCSIITE